MPMSRSGKLSWVLGVGLAVACGAGHKELEQARGSGYDTSYDAVWDATVEALREEYPIIKEMDKGQRKIVTCWKPIDRASRDPGAPWRLFRIIVEISPEAPYRVAVSGRAADYSAPQIRPFEPGAFEEPGWREAKTDRVVREIHARLAQNARPATDGALVAANPEARENQADTCVIHPELMGINTRGMVGIPIGDRGAMLQTEK